MATQRIYALFQDVLDAERAIGALHDHGIASENIGVAGRRPAEQMEGARVHDSYTRLTDQENMAEGEPEAAYIGTPGGTPATAYADTVTPASTADTAENVEDVGKTGITTTTAQDAMVGMGYGSAVGLIGGILAAAAAVTIPGVGLILGGGALAAAFGAAAATTAAGAVAGGVAGYLRDMGMPEQAASSFADRIHEGDYLVTATIDTDEYDEVKRLLLKYNAAGVDINETQTTSGFADPPVPVVTDTAPMTPIVTHAPLIAPVPPVIVSDPMTPGIMPTLAETPPATTPFTESTAPEPLTRIITEEADGTPIIPARTVSNPAANSALEVEAARTTERETRDAIT